MSFKPGDRVVRIGPSTKFINFMNVVQYEVYTIAKVRDWLVALEDVGEVDWFEARNFELEHIYNSPLYQALR